jgi:hypothetical protein
MRALLLIGGLSAAHFGLSVVAALAPITGP